MVDSCFPPNSCSSQIMFLSLWMEPYTSGQNCGRYQCSCGRRGLPAPMTSWFHPMSVVALLGRPSPAPSSFKAINRATFSVSVEHPARSPRTEILFALASSTDRMIVSAALPLSGSRISLSLRTSSVGSGKGGVLLAVPVKPPTGNPTTLLPCRIFVWGRISGKTAGIRYWLEDGTPTNSRPQLVADSRFGEHPPSTLVLVFPGSSVVERVAVNHQVGGSNPPRETKLFSR